MKKQKTQKGKKVYYFDLQNLDTGNDDKIIVVGDEKLGTRAFWAEVFDRALKATDPEELEEGDGLTPETVIDILKTVEGIEFVEAQHYGISLPNAFDEVEGCLNMSELNTDRQKNGAA